VTGQLLASCCKSGTTGLPVWQSSPLRCLRRQYTCIHNGVVQHTCMLWAAGRSALCSSGGVKHACPPYGDAMHACAEVYACWVAATDLAQLSNCKGRLEV
jgi:hypothetical protein